MRRILLALLILFAACDPTAPEAEKRPKKISVHPDAVTLAPLEGAQFTVVPASVAVVWSVQEPGGGTVTQAGFYTAPAASGLYHVVATASATVQASAAVTVSSGIAITAPTPQIFVACVPGPLHAAVTGSANTAVLWSGIDPACGSITDGVFTSLNVTGTCPVRASAAADLGRYVDVVIQVDPARILGVAISPPTAATSPGGSVSFSATVTTSCGTFPAVGQ
jgi:hypothetical protein